MRVNKRVIARRKAQLVRIGTAMTFIAIGIIIAALIAVTASGGDAADAVDGVVMAAPDLQIEPQALTYTEPITPHPMLRLDETPNLLEPNPEDVEMLAKLLYGEARGVESETEQAAVVWCVLNRVDATGYACGGNIEQTVTFKNQFTGYDPDNPVEPELAKLAKDVLTRWYAEKAGYTNVGRVLPKKYLYFMGDGHHNHFTTEYKGDDCWDWELDSPYLT